MMPLCSAEQIKWMAQFVVATGLKPVIGIDELRSGELNFGEFARANVAWYDTYAAQLRHKLISQIPEDPILPKA